MITLREKLRLDSFSGSGERVRRFDREIRMISSEQRGAVMGPRWRQVNRLQGSRGELFVVEGNGRSIKIDGGLESLESADERGDLMTAWQDWK